MKSEVEIIRKAEFTPRIKSYLLVYGAFILTITFIGIPLLPFWFLGLGQYFCKRYYNSLQCKLTSRHLAFKKGALFKVEKTIPLENIQDLTFIQNPLLNAFDLRVLKIETAGQSNPQGSDMKLIGIIDTEAFRDSVLEQREVLRLDNRRGSKPLSPQSSNELMNILTEIRDLLKEIKGN